MSKSCEISHHHDGIEDEDDNDDPFACFGSDSEDSAADGTNDHDADPTTTTNCDYAGAAGGAAVACPSTKVGLESPPQTTTTDNNNNHTPPPVVVVVAETGNNNNNTTKSSSQKSHHRPRQPHHIVSDYERSRRLMVANIAKQKNASIEHVPIHSPNNFEVFDDHRNGRGMGLRALRSYSIGDEILREGATLRISNSQRAMTQEEADTKACWSVQTAFNNLSSTTAQALQDLSSCQEDDDNKTPFGIYNTNSFLLDGESDGGLFLTIARINHSCRPNVHHSWRPELQKMIIHAVRNIQVGEEICISYGPSECLDTIGRRQFLNHRFAFICQCDMCCEGNQLGGDDRMEEINALHDDISLFAASNNSNVALQAVDRCLQLLQEQGIGMGAYKQITNYGYQISLTKLHNNNLARSYLLQQLEAVKMTEGDGSYNVIDTQQLLDDLDSFIKEDEEEEEKRLPV